MSRQAQFVAAARRCLRVGRKSLSVAQSLDLAAQVCAVGAGLKPALLYDSNGAGAEQLQEYLTSVQSLGLLPEWLLTLDLNGNSLIINPVTVRSHLERVLGGDSAVVIDVFHSLERPVVTELQRSGLRSAARALLLVLDQSQQVQQVQQARTPVCVGETCEQWNLCSVFGMLLGFPVVYWFDQTRGFDNCLSMTPLLLTTASATWPAGAAGGHGCAAGGHGCAAGGHGCAAGGHGCAAGGHRCALYSFSVPAALSEATRCDLERWKLRLQQAFEQQQVLKDLRVDQSTVSLPSVCL